MRTANPALINGLKAASTAADLEPYLQAAMQLEFATIPIYLGGLFSIRTVTGPDGKPAATNPAVANIITAVANEEMLHMCIVANTMIALGLKPDIYPTLIPRAWPITMPLGVDDSLTIGVAPLSGDVVLNTYMRIEEPDTILQPTVGAPIPLAPAPAPNSDQYQSIGDFYEALIAKILELPEGSFDASRTSRQVIGAFYSDPPSPAAITDADSCVSQLRTIIDEGEGSSTSPFENFALDPAETPSHFYRFAQIVMNGTVTRVQDTSGAVTGYTFATPEIGWDDSQAVQFPPNPTLSLYKDDPVAFAAARAFTAGFNVVVSLLDQAFNGDPTKLQDAVDAMFNLPALAAVCANTVVDEASQTVVGLCFERLPQA